MAEHEEEGSITRWIGVLIKGGRIDAAAQALWERYYARLVNLARKRFRPKVPGGIADAEDAALSAFDSFCRGAAAGRYPQLGGRNDLWRLLVTITARKVADQVERESAEKRDWRRRWNESDMQRPGADHGSGGGELLAEVVGREPSPEFVAVMAEQCQRLLDGLGDSALRQVALMKMEGYQNEDIARRMNCSLRSIERKLGLIRKTWQREGAA